MIGSLGLPRSPEKRIRFRRFSIMIIDAPRICPAGSRRAEDAELSRAGSSKSIA